MNLSFVTNNCIGRMWFDENEEKINKKWALVNVFTNAKIIYVTNNHTVNNLNAVILFTKLQSLFVYFLKLSFWQFRL